MLRRNSFSPLHRIKSRVTTGESTEVSGCVRIRVGYMLVEYDGFVVFFNEGVGL